MPELTAAERMADFLAFSTLELRMGGPDPYVRVAGRLVAQASDPITRAWRAGCYAACHEVMSGSILMQWNPQGVLSDPQIFEAWIEKHWKVGIFLRRERRAVRTPAKFIRCMLSLAEWSVHTFPGVLQHNPGVSYEDYWTSLKDVYGFGRYAMIKILEVLCQGNSGVPPAPDIRPRGGWSPRLTLSELYPEEAGDLSEGNGATALETVQRYTDDVRRRLADASGRPSISYFEIEVLLCNYRQAFSGRYPGRSLDTDHGYAQKIIGYWGSLPFPYYEWRPLLFPREGLAEVQGWPGVRKELAETREQYGYFWADVLYDYLKTTDLSAPVRRSPPAITRQAVRR